MKTYVLLIAKHFMKGHPRAGEETHFEDYILCAFGRSKKKGKIISIESISGKSDPMPKKIHTIRANYDLWKSRADEINAGKAILSLRQWRGKPYRSKQKEFLRLGKIGVQKAKVFHMDFPKLKYCEAHRRIGVWVDGDIRDLGLVAVNDGLSERDFIDWFKKDFDGAIIHFTNCRY